MSSRFVLPYADIGSGISPSDGAKLYFYETGTDTPKDTYSDQLGTPTPNDNPVIADSTGVFSDIFIVGSYYVVLKNKNDVQIWDADPVDESFDASSAQVYFETYTSKQYDVRADMIADSTLVDGQIVETKEVTAGDGSGARYLIEDGDQSNGLDALLLDNGKTARRKAVFSNLIGRNLLINGNFEVSQRATTFNSPSAGDYILDRWVNNTATAVDYEQVSPFASTTHTKELKVTAQATAEIQWSQSLELSTATAAKGKTVTLSFSANSSHTPSLSASIQKSSTADDSQASFSTVANEAWTLGSPTTARYTLTTQIPNDGTAEGLRVLFAAPDIASGEIIYMWDVQLEVGSQATDFEHVDPETQLSRCQRFYEAFEDGGYNVNTAVSLLSIRSSSQGSGHIPFKTTKRAAPTLEVTTAGAWNILGSVSESLSSFTADVGVETCMINWLDAGTPFATIGACYVLVYGTAGNKLAFNSEI